MYVVSKWHVNAERMIDLQRLYELATSLGGDFLILPDIFFHEDKPFVDTILINVDQGNYDEFVTRTERVGFTEWEEAEIEDFEERDNLVFNPFVMSEFDQQTWEARLHMAHRHNRRLELYGTGIILEETA